VAQYQRPGTPPTPSAICVSAYALAVWEQKIELIKMHANYWPHVRSPCFMPLGGGGVARYHGYQVRDISGIPVSASGRKRRGPPTFASSVNVPNPPFFLRPRSDPERATRGGGLSKEAKPGKIKIFSSFRPLPRFKRFWAVFFPEYDATWIQSLFTLSKNKPGAEESKGFGQSPGRAL